MTQIKASFQKSVRTIVILWPALLFFLSPGKTFSQSTGTLRGLVTDSVNSEALAYASVAVKEIRSGAFTDSKGYFIMTSLPANRPLTLVISYTGYTTRTIQFMLVPGKLTHLDIKLKPVSILLPVIETIGKRKGEANETNISVQHLTMKQLEVMPKGVETDIFRSLHNIAGVRSTGDVSARYYIRGGASNQNLVQMNGATIYNPFHALGLFSVVDPEMVNSAEFYKGGFPAEYGGRLSSVMNLSTKDGNKNSYSGRASVSLLSTKALAEGPIPYGSFIITGRKSYSDKIYRKFINKDMPLDFFDMSFKVNYSNPEFVKDSKLSLYGFASYDNLEYQDLSRADMNWGNQLFGFDWFQISDSPLFFDLGISFSSFRGEILPNKSQVLKKVNEVRDVTFKMNFNYVYESKDELACGINILNLNTDLLLGNTGALKNNLSSFGTNYVFFAKYKFLRFENLGIDLGARVNVTGLTSTRGEFPIEPRFSFTWRIIPQIALKGATGIFRQEITTLSDENEVLSLFEPWIITPVYLKAASAKHYILGLETNFTENISLEVEGYYKLSENITMLNEKKIFPADPDLTSGNGKAYGLESALKLEVAPFNFMASYSLGYAYNNVNGWKYYPKYDARHSCNLSADLALEGGWTISAVWTFTTGLPYTRQTGFYDKMQIDDFYNMNGIYNSFYQYLLLDDKNLGRLPAYHRLDVSLGKRFETELANLFLDVSVMNIYDRKNIFYFDRITGKRTNMLPFLPTATLKVEL
ncbi:MAG: TonB-dependent receptor [Syntrophothermus sp.]